MALMTTKEMLLKAQREGYAVGAFNAENMEMVQAVIEAAEEMKAPVIIQTTPGTLNYADPEMFYGMCAAAAQKASVPVALHLDHGNSFEMAARALKAGYTSVMIDGSKEEFEANVTLSRRVAEMAHAMGIPVEGELGTVGGKEDNHEVKAAKRHIQILNRPENLQSGQVWIHWRWGSVMPMDFIRVIQSCGLIYWKRQEKEFQFPSCFTGHPVFRTKT